MSNFILAQISIVLVFVVYRLFFRKKQDLLPLPPGPKPLPLVGNINDLPPPGVPEFEHWLTFKDKYGPVSSVTVLGQTMVILHDKAAVIELLEKSSLKTSGRPVFFFGAEMCGYGGFMPTMQYNDLYRQHRKFIHQQMGTKILASRFNDVQDIESKRLLLRTLKDPKNFFEHIKTEASAIMLRITYGYVIEPLNQDPLIQLMQDVMTNLSSAFLPLYWATDFVPAIRHLPDWFPGTGFKQTARKWKSINDAVTKTPYDFVQKQMENGIYQQISYVSEHIKAHGHGDGTGVSEEDSSNIALTATDMYGGGADTTVSTIMAFTLAMILFPEVQKKAQEEIDRVVGSDRLPGYEDQDNLPYTTAVAKEALRYFSIVPIGTAHRAEEEITFRGYRIPKGSFILPSIWWFSHDPEVYKNPLVFEPERFLEPRNEPDPGDEAFGYGRRVCPGRYLATESIYITVVRLLAAFTITKGVDANGKEIDVECKQTPGLISHPVKFSYGIKPRNKKYEDLIRKVEVDHPWEKSDAEFLEGDVMEEYKQEVKKNQQVS
ncbi:cytochrome P450 [Trichoderma afarasin]|uniref:O-methylsterigmatocystin oxidoreductase n=1 Tax=Trichoderma lentiforme TaxID=1567552 RepID=A0A9P4XHQ3_9HYPO|nr:O-methylsterigmatocystin oxidoreductase [Trichoderma lentiforme]